LVTLYYSPLKRLRGDPIDRSALDEMLRWRLVKRRLNHEAINRGKPDSSDLKLPSAEERIKSGRGGEKSCTK